MPCEHFKVFIVRIITQRICSLEQEMEAITEMSIPPGSMARVKMLSYLVAVERELNAMKYLRSEIEKYGDSHA